MRGGDYSNGGLSNRSNYGYYWSRRLYNAANGYRLDFYSGEVYTQYDNRRGNGLALRCLARLTFLIAYAIIRI